ncbi:hypothetical protein BANRA_01658 [Klebsiella pneumoniae]|nr:hypothetical protein BANRA_01658 [Klebsiella pneumoniae]
MKEKISKIDKNFYTDIFIKTSFQNEFEAGELYHQLPRIKYQQSVTKIKHSIL